MVDFEIRFRKFKDGVARKIKKAGNGPIKKIT